MVLLLFLCQDNMVIKVSVKGDFKNLSGKLKKIQSDFDTGTFLQETAQLLNSSIQTRVQKDGKGIDGSSLDPYSKKYGAYKESKGRQTGFRDLTFSGKMWQSLTTSKTSKSAKMYFGNAESVNKASGNNKRTPFFGIGPKEKAIIKSQINNLIKNLTKGF